MGTNRNNKNCYNTKLILAVATIVTALLATLVFAGCDDDGNIILPPVLTPSPVVTPTLVPDPLPTNIPTANPTSTETPAPTTNPTNPPDASLFIPENCNNPPKTISYNSGFTCKGSDTRGDTVVCLLPWEFTWKPYVVADKGYLSSTKHFAAVHLVLKNGNFIDLSWAGYANPVYLANVKVNRQHWRNESIKWSSISNRVDYIEMQRGGKRTCLKF